MNIEEVSTSKEFISKEYRLSLNQKEGSSNTKKKWYVTFTCEKCLEVVTNVFQKNTWKFQCGRCSRGRKTTAQFIEEAKKVHGERFSYEKTKYINNSTPLLITCSLHGDFFQRPTDHVGGQTVCPICSARERTQAIPLHLREQECTLYWGYIPSINMWKIGVTVQNLNKRFSYKEETLSLIWSKSLPYSEAVSLEKEIKTSTREVRYNKDKKLLANGGDYELYYENIFPTYEKVKELLDACTN